MTAGLTEHQEGARHRAEQMQMQILKSAASPRNTEMRTTAVPTDPVDRVSDFLEAAAPAAVKPRGCLGSAASRPAANARLWGNLSLPHLFCPCFSQGLGTRSENPIPGTGGKS